MYCIKCAAQLVEDAEFCHKCGCKVPLISEIHGEASDEQKTLKAEVDNDEKTASAEAENTDEDSACAESERKSNKRFVVWMCIIVGVVLLVAGIIIVGSEDSGSQVSTNSASREKEMIDLCVKTELISEIRSEYGYIEDIDIGSTRYSIATVTDNGDEWIVRGTFTLYDYYGKMTSFYDETFTARVKKESYRTECTIS